MKLLQDILFGVSLREVVGSTQLSIKDIQIDSRKVQEGSVFVAIKGIQADGHEFIATAIQKGAIAIVCEKLPHSLQEGVVFIVVANAQESVAVMAHHFYDNPSTHIKLVGVTGTNGKTTVATLLFKLFKGLGYTCGLISTVENHIAVSYTHLTLPTSP
jgi:UDP-N-acetylmuramoyl-L-alanyl-D-glutamate--2,6-diaminopimelate ligase